MIPITYLAEASDIVDGDRSRDCGRDRAKAEKLARQWSGNLTECVAYVVTIRGRERIGHRVFISGRIDRTEGEYPLHGEA